VEIRGYFGVQSGSEVEGKLSLLPGRVRARQKSLIWLRCFSAVSLKIHKVQKSKQGPYLREPPEKTKLLLARYEQYDARYYRHSANNGRERYIVGEHGGTRTFIAGAKCPAVTNAGKVSFQRSLPLLNLALKVRLEKPGSAQVSVGLPEAPEFWRRHYSLSSR